MSKTVGTAMGEAGRERSGRWIPWMFVLFFAVIFAVNGTMVWYALESWTGLDDAEYYNDGVTYDRNIDAERRAEALGWHADLKASRVDEATHELLLGVTDRDGRPVSDATIGARLRRPTQAALDTPLTFQPAAPGQYRARVALPAPGLWEAHIRVVRGKALFVVAQRFVLN